MAKTSNIFARVEPEVKEQAEQVLEQLGIPMSNAIGLMNKAGELTDELLQEQIKEALRQYFEI